MFGYILIFFAKIIEVSLTTVRVVLITRGEKFYGAIIGFFEVLIWLYVISTVLVGISKEPFKMVIYALGFSCGNYIGCILEDKLALGLMTINAIVSEKDGHTLAKILRAENVGVTIIDAEGLKEDKKMLILHVKRKRKSQILKIIHNSHIKAVISLMDTKTIYGGYGIKK
ncbi:DUF5698 domain-containing protein [Clostridium tagluense]|uniref:DUF2179 domain-containing protein n=1 Tax=Clostridium tagluense TaxID=360422 RepID=UPI001C0AA7E8|nr:DUF5698 domain-containing protein [Clostridium tagluense]MBU3129233.1 DUF2179 domain-containing protein [Clostridium tagluense]MBW9158247.1 DUF2179 domain-containing protein [Clostridium tagluense]MCB2310278.1 DUF5698 domain-containing protein [Clostridium tagluense]MCB2315080.1 DUF5698 domain-containing protein [Clostridium tagluense]MCB2319978.1 DUF5698 domain-containing protein [Clostridium tagluense]